MKIILARLSDKETAERLRANAEHLLRTTKNDTDLIGAFEALEINARWYRASESTEAAAKEHADSLVKGGRVDPKSVRIVADPKVPLTAKVISQLVK